MQTKRGECSTNRYLDNMADIRYFNEDNKLYLNKMISYDDLLNIMKTETYSAGVPFIAGIGIKRCIQFPSANQYNIQVLLASRTVIVAIAYSGGRSGVSECRWKYNAAVHEQTKLAYDSGEICEKLVRLLKENIIA